MDSLHHGFRTPAIRSAVALDDAIRAVRNKTRLPKSADYCARIGARGSGRCSPLRQKSASIEIKHVF